MASAFTLRSVPATSGRGQLPDFNRAKTWRSWKSFCGIPAGLTDNFVLHSIVQIFDEPVTKTAENSGFRNLLAGL